LVLDYAFGELDLHRVEANVQPENHASIRLLKRLRFRKEGLTRKYLKIDGHWRDHERWAILAKSGGRADAAQQGARLCENFLKTPCVHPDPTGAGGAVSG